ncbi:MAG: saccharopine dehydrogenase NADP-binding domain-containing protein [Deltaproteobacteria bacterium]|nr:saccharopine dehydrogenase NADP-binding domain-containing protein [Deltaproteobacteria bacterium]MBW2393203.1 saccharopine dehydrogenase NADP-binding domain-containing protein [Deltaproteobacteria bacterium]
MSKTIVVVGATGEMGSRVCRLIRRLAPTALLVGTNRSGRGHAELPIHQLEVADREGMAALLTTADLVINAVGPYTYDPAPLVHAAISSRCHYADLSEQLAFVERVREVGEQRAAAKAGVLVLPGCSTVPGLVDVLAQRWQGDSEVAGLRVFLSMGSRNPVTRALLSSLLQPIGRKGPSGRWFDKLVAHEVLDGRELYFGPYPVPFSNGQVRLGQRLLPIHFHMGFDRRALNRMLALAAPMLGRLSPRWVERFASIALPVAKLARNLGTERGILSVVAEDADGRERGRTEVIAETAGLDIPALPAAWLTQALVREGWAAAPGVRSLSRVIDAQQAAVALVEAGYAVQIR